VELLVSLGLLLDLSGSSSVDHVSHSHVNLGLDLGKVGLNVGVALSEFPLGKFSNFSSLEALLVLEQALGSTEEAIQRNHLLQKSQLGVGSLLLLVGDGLLEGVLDVGVDL
jgi:hypothetical protein